MATYGLQFDLSQLEKEFSFFNDINKRLENAIETLAAQAYGQAIKLTQEQLTSRRNTFLENLSFSKEGSGKDAVYVIILNAKAMWIEEGHEAFNLKDTLKGETSRVVPFKHNSNQPSLQSAKQQQAYSEIKSFLKKNKVSLSKPITNQAGQPILSSPGNVRPAATFSKVPSSTVSKKSGESILNRMNIYQHETTGKGGQKSIQKSIMTFRTVSQNSDTSEWNIPPLKAAKIMDQTYQWILENYEKIISEALVDIIVSGA